MCGLPPLLSRVFSSLVQRNGRFVIPVKNTFKRTGLGIVHDQSNTGKTVYIEPVQVTRTGLNTYFAESCVIAGLGAL